MRSRPQLVRSLSLSFFVALVFASGAFAEAPIPIDYDYGDSALSLSALGAENPVEFQGRLTRPATMDGVHPIVVLLHGRHSTCEGPFGETLRWPCAGSEQPTPSHLGYDYLAEALANKGIVVISISANGINAMDNYVEDGGAMARAELIQEHLKLLERANTGSVEPFGDALVGHLDLTRVGTMGHSRGGEGVVQHYLYNKQLGEPFGIKAVLPLAPVSFGSLTPAGVPLAVTLGYCDGDVYTLDGVHYFDRIRPNASDSAPKHLVVLYGGNHNFFNTVWSPTTYGPGAMDDWEIMETYVGKDAHCSASSAQNGRLTEEEQKDTL
ncbi:MAG: hypothetical protein KC417_13330, partial [Myxococcales bacterium]|nr:hypothetical protein [Myxococcales bacterium]